MATDRTPLQALESLLTHALVDAEGDPVDLYLVHPMDEESIDRFAATLPCPLPHEIRELLRFARGFEGGYFYELQFDGLGPCEADDLFPHGIVMANDGQYGYWVVDITADSQTWGPVYFLGYDPPVLLYQAADLTEFLDQTIQMHIPPCASPILEVHWDRVRNVSKTNPDAVSQPEAAAAPDADLRAFAETLEPDWLLIDLRNAKPGDGFSWRRFGPTTRIRRAGNLPIFAYRPLPQRSLLSYYIQSKAKDFKMGSNDPA